jgi:hypothetical protein
MRPHAKRSIRSKVLALAGALAVVAGTMAPAAPAAAANICTNLNCQYGPEWFAVMGTRGVGSSFWGAAAGHNCTGYVAWRMSQLGVPKPSGVGNASNWATKASAAGYTVDNIPAVGAVAQWNSYAGGYGVEGHVAVVEAVNGSTITVSEDTYYAQEFRWRTISSSAPSNYIHFHDAPVFKFVIAPGDMDGDGQPDLLAVSNSGSLTLHRGTSEGSFAASDQGEEIGTSWAQFKSVFAVGDVTSDGNPDVMAIKTTGELILYTGNGAGTFSNSAGGTQIGTSWQNFKSVFGVGDLTGDGNADWLAITTGGDLTLYAGNGAGGYAPGIVIGTSWAQFKSAFGVGDLNSDGHPDVLAIKTTGELFLYTGNGAGGFSNSVGGTQIGTSWHNYKSVFGAGDIDGDGTPDVIALDSAGEMWRYSGDGSGSFVPGTGTVKGTSSWNLFKTATTVGDWNSDTHPDVLAIQTDGKLLIYKGDGISYFSNPAGGTQVGTSWAAFKTVFGVGDLSGDGIDDLLAIATDGKLYLYQGDGASGYAPAVQIGSSWAGFKDAFGVGDLSGDGFPDVLAIKTDGTLVLYTGNGAGNFSNAAGGTTIGSSWASFKHAFGAGDVNGDGNPDVMAISIDGSLRVYYGNGAGNFSNAAGGTILTSSGWGAFHSVFGAGDVNHDGYQDLWAIETNGQLKIFLGNSSNRYTTEQRLRIGTGW